MKTFSNFLNEKYVLNIETLKNIITENASDVVIKNFDLKKVKKLVYVSVDDAKSIGKLHEIGVTSYFVNPETLSFVMENDSIILTDNKTKVALSKKDAVDTIILMRSGYKDKNINFMLSVLTQYGIMVINDTESIKVSSDKYNTALLMKNNNIPTPKCCLITKKDITIEDDSEFEKKLKTIYPKLDDNCKFVCKILGGHGGKGVFCCTYFNIKSIIQCLFAINNEQKIIVQEFLNIKDGDIRVNVLSLNGKQQIFNVTMRKKMSDDFRTNLSLGNKIDDSIKLTPEQEKIALNAARVSGLTWAGVDLLPTQEGDTYVVELNGSPGPMSNINTDDAIDVNFAFYKNLIETINTLCK